jgi:hypothetical protein
MAIQGQCAQLLQVALLPAVGASMSSLPGRQLAHAVHHAVVGGDDVGGRRALDHGAEQLARWTHHVGLLAPRCAATRGAPAPAPAGALFAQQFQLQALELVVHDAGAVPHQHVGAGLLLDVAAQVAVGCPQDLLALGLQVR